MEYVQELFSLAGRTALVTGGSSGIGREMARTIARAGASVVLLSRNQSNLDTAVAELRELGCTASSVRVDLGDRDLLLRAADEVAELFDEPDIVINAAATNYRPRLEEVTAKDWDHTMAVNLDAPFLLGQRFAPSMIKKGWGRIINIGSQQCERAFGNSGAYGVSKAGITALTRSQAEAWSPYGICCNAVAPGFVSTSLTREVSADPARLAQLAARTMIGRNGETRDFAGVTLFLASPASDYVTGQTIFVDGGFSVH